MHADQCTINEFTLSVELIELPFYDNHHTHVFLSRQSYSDSNFDHIRVTKLPRKSSE